MTSDEGARLRVADVVSVTEAEGPGRRFAVWSQGCSVRCIGCFNPHLWTTEGGSEVDPVELAERAISCDVEGVTLLGGEPFDQAPAFALFAEQVRRAGLSVMTFTGHYREALEQSQEAGVGDLLRATDLLVDGPYEAAQMDKARPWVGSRNQRFHFMSDRYRSIERVLSQLPDRLEIRIAADGTTTVNGWSDVARLDDLLADCFPRVGRGRVS